MPAEERMPASGPEPGVAGALPPPQRALRDKLLRFPLVGLLSSVVYAVATWVCISQLHLDHRVASLLGYLTALPVSFLGHRHFTFAATGKPSAEIVKFAAVHSIGMGLSWLSVSATDWMHVHYAFGIVGAVVLVPIMSFLVLDRWVFRMV